MADLISDGFLRVQILTVAPANQNAPTVSELNAGLRIDTVMTPDGLNITPSTARVDVSALSSTFNAEKVGRRSFANSVKIKAQDTGDTALSTLAFQALVWIVVRRKLAAGTAYATGQAVEVYPSQCDQRIDSYGPNTVQAFEVGLAMVTDPSPNAVIA